jgi:hypothetical protein
MIDPISPTTADPVFEWRFSSLVESPTRLKTNPSRGKGKMPQIRPAVPQPFGTRSLGYDGGYGIGAPAGGAT